MDCLLDQVSVAGDWSTDSVDAKPGQAVTACIDIINNIDSHDHIHIRLYIQRGRNGKTSYLHSVLAKRPNYKVLQNQSINQNL